MPNPKTAQPKSKRFSLPHAADELALLTEAAEALDRQITELKCKILVEIGPLWQDHTPLTGIESQWDIRCLPTSTISWRKIAEQAGATSDMIAMHTVKRNQVSFKRLPKEVTK